MLHLSAKFLFFTFSVIFILVDHSSAGYVPGNIIEELPTCDKSLLNGSYTFQHYTYCDKYYACYKGTPYLMQCEDGFAYMPYHGCKLLHEVDCSKRPLLQTPHGSGACPRLYGLYEDSHGCGKYISCFNGTAVTGQCPNSLIFDSKDKVCRYPTNEEKQKCSPGPALIGCTGGNNLDPGTCTLFQCPVNNELPYGDHSRHPYPGHCKHFIMCLRDGTIKIGGCEKGLAFNPESGVCDPESEVKGCEPHFPVPTHTTHFPVPAPTTQFPVATHPTPQVVTSTPTIPLV